MASRSVVPVVLAGLLLSGCGAPATRHAGLFTEPSPTPTAQRYAISGTVLESPQHPAELCWGVLTSLPPQCRGLTLDGFSWDDVEGEESVGGTTWKVLRLVGTWDGTLHLTEKPSLPVPQSPPPRPDFPMPCPEPSGGWVIVDRDTVAQRDMEALSSYARRQPDFAGLWLSRPDGVDASKTPSGQGIVNIAFTGDLERHEREARELWGGQLCVSRGAHTYDELKRIQTAIEKADGEAFHLMGSGLDDAHNAVDVTVLILDDKAQSYFDSHFPPGTVSVTGRAQPL